MPEESVGRPEELTEGGVASIGIADESRGAVV